MRIALIALGVVALALILIVGAALALSPSTEVVTLFTHGPGGTQQTSLWVVEEEGQLWLRAGDPSSAWLARLRENPHIQLKRGEETGRYRAELVESEQTRGRINRLMAEKYGASNSLVEIFASHEESIPVRLERRPG